MTANDNWPRFSCFLREMVHLRIENPLFFSGHSWMDMKRYNQRVQVLQTSAVRNDLMKPEFYQMRYDRFFVLHHMVWEQEYNLNGSVPGSGFKAESSRLKAHCKKCTSLPIFKPNGHSIPSCQFSTRCGRSSFCLYHIWYSKPLNGYIGYGLSADDTDAFTRVANMKQKRRVTRSGFFPGGPSCRVLLQ